MGVAAAGGIVDVSLGCFLLALEAGVSEHVVPDDGTYVEHTRARYSSEMTRKHPHVLVRNMDEHG